MAQAIICDVCETAAADFLVTNMADGSTFAACGVDYFAFCRSMAEAAPEPPAEQEPEPPLADAGDSEGEALETASANGKPKSNPEASADETEQQQPAETEPAAATND